MVIDIEKEDIDEDEDDDLDVWENTKIIIQSYFTYFLHII